MKSSKNTLFLLAVLLCIASKNIAQEMSEKKEKRNIIEGYIPIIHFFDDHKTNWTYAFPTVFGIYKPITFGFSYNRFNKKNTSGFSASFAHYLIVWWSSYKFSGQQGEIYLRGFNIYTVGYQHHLIEYYGMNFWAHGNLILRKGGGNFITWGYRGGDRRKLFDPGISAGIRATKFLPLNFTLTFESYFTQVLYRVDQGPTLKKPSNYYFNNGAARNMLHLNYKLGYRF